MTKISSHCSVFFVLFCLGATTSIVASEINRSTDKLRTSPHLPFEQELAKMEQHRREFPKAWDATGKRQQKIKFSKPNAVISNVGQDCAHIVIIGNSEMGSCMGALRYRKKDEKTWSKDFTFNLLAEQGLHHSLKLTGLQPGASYEYWVGTFLPTQQMDLYSTSFDWNEDAADWGPSASKFMIRYFTTEEKNPEETEGEKKLKRFGTLARSFLSNKKR